MTNTHIHVPEAPFWDRDIYGSAMHNGVPVFSKIGRGPRGYKGDKGDKGDTGAAGEEGFSPWTEFAYPDDPSYPIEPGEEHYGHPVIIVHDRDGDHWYALDPKPDPDSMSEDDLAKLASQFTDKKLWPQWVEWEIIDGSQSPTQEGRDEYTQLNLTYHDGARQLYLINDSLYYTQYPYFLHNPERSTDIYSVGDFVIEDAQFIRNGLDYQFVKGPGELFMASDDPLPTYNPHFFLSSYSNFNPISLFFYPKLSTGHRIEECLLRLRLCPKYPEE